MACRIILMIAWVVKEVVSFQALGLLMSVVVCNRMRAQAHRPAGRKLLVAYVETVTNSYSTRNT